MIPVLQTKFGAPDGNCLEACVASILEVSVEELPVLADEPDAWFGRLQEWLNRRGWECGYFPVHWPVQPVGCYIMNGPGPRGFLHSVVARDGIMIHDPHPSGLGLLGVLSYLLVFRTRTRSVEE